MSNSYNCSWDCILSMIGVGFLWGATNPLLRLGSKASVQEKAATGVHPSHNIWRRLLSPFVDLTALLMNWKFSIPFIVNQSASVLFIMLISRYSVSVVVPCVNALQFVFTAIVGHLIGERILSCRSCIGAVMVTIGVLIMMTSDALSA
ncbi:hypothetical protein ANCCAN_08345 [Ancylostoma caninum]|uniref:Transmembrane protein 234 homolog n=1 Tax=Ancylostoma caninum TaxID=29170 RepID=A0A368GRN4_ANCCA|nr:hypothetical protein ANCCAN_08345 [Ancylostoma caninum]